MNYINRALEADIRTSLKRNPATAILGPRQCGKSTLARKILDEIKPSVYLDLERPSDIQKLQDPEWFLGSQSDKLICLDEIQRYPELFPVLRSLIDAEGRNGMYIILGSASRDMLKQSSETLAGRISFKQLTPFIWEEVNASKTLEDYLSRGGFPRSLLAENDEASYEWRRDFIMTFLERDLLQFAGFTPATMRRLWQMLAHSNGQTVNYSSLGNSLGVSHTTIRNYIDLLEGAFMVRQVLPYFENTKKRIVKSPKVYITDTGLINALLGLKDFIQVAGHPGFGSLWETTVLVNLFFTYLSSPNPDNHE
jgi:predicted AAA+ superfamily ATPase